MSRYQYRAVDTQGNLVSGETTADSTGQAIAKLERQGLKVQSISFVDTELEHFESLSAEEQAAAQQLREAAIRNARSWASPLLALSQEVQSRWLSRALSKLASKLQNVTRLESLASDRETAELFPLVIKELDSNSDSDSWLMKLTQQLESRRSHRQALLYPIASILFLGAILVAGAIWVVPIFQQMFDEFGLTLPGMTKLVFTVSSWIYPHTLRTILLLAIAVVIVAMLIRVIRRSVWLHLRFPFITSGSRSNLRAVSIVCQNSAELLQLQYPLAQAIRLSAQGCRQNSYGLIASQLSDELETSGSANSALTLRTLPPLLLGVLSSGTADANTLSRLGRLYRDRERDRSRQFVLVLSQIGMASTGLIIGVVVIALFLPLFRMVTSLA